jgi:2-hydroxy-6-oxonona-2,4-dienedioate hydrolase
MPLTEENILLVEGLCSRWVNLPGGVRAHYMTAGETGPAVVLLHGGIIGSSGTAGWRFMAPFLAGNGFRVFAPDMPAFGLTHDPLKHYKPGLLGHLNFTRDFVDALCLPEFHLAGNSMGCQNAVNFVTAYPERILSYALIAGGIGDLSPREEELRRDTRPPEERANYGRGPFDGSNEWMRRTMSSIIHRPEAIDDDLVEMRTMAALSQWAGYQDHAAAFAHPDPMDRAALRTKGRFDKLTIPGIYLFGRQDVLSPAHIRGYMQEDVLPDVQFFYPGECGHQGQTDQPEMFNQVFLEFFRDGRVSRKTADWAGVSARRPENPALVEQ